MLPDKIWLSEFSILNRVSVSSLFVKFLVEFSTGMAVLQMKYKISVLNRVRV